jgi:hypothetical protein
MLGSHWSGNWNSGLNPDMSYGAVAVENVVREVGNGEGGCGENKTEESEVVGDRGHY